MTLSQSSIDNYISKQVQSGSCSSTVEAEKELVAKLAERELDRDLEEGQADLDEGRFITITPEWKEKTTARLAKKFLPKTK